MNQEKIEIIMFETKEIYNRNNDNIKHIDNKLVQLFVFVNGLLLLFINLLNYPSECTLRFLYLITVGLFIIVLFLIVTAYKPRSYLAIDPNALINKYYNKNKTKEELLESIIGTTAENVNSLKEMINQKCTLINISTYLLIITVLFMVILKVNVI
jgi:hypothetical protein